MTDFDVCYKEILEPNEISKDLGKLIWEDDNFGMKNPGSLQIWFKAMDRGPSSYVKNIFRNISNSLIGSD